ncbi:MAG: alcohol dehydrogenase catalytic domain-containing protein [Nitrososphaeraceae archaeon]
MEVRTEVAVGWYGGHCGHCESCRRGDFITCKYAQVPGISYDGGYADYMIAPYSALALIPEHLSAIEAAPLMCAGITTYNALRNSGARIGDTVTILGIGGLGHLGIQFAAKIGFRTVAIGRGKDKEEMVKKLVPFTTLIANLKMLLKNLSSLAVVVKMVYQ